MTNIQSKSLIPFCKFIDKSVIHVSIFYMYCVRQLLIHFLYIDGVYSYVYVCVYINMYTILIYKVVTITQTPSMKLVY